MIICKQSAQYISLKTENANIFFYEGKFLMWFRYRAFINIKQHTGCLKKFQGLIMQL